MNLNALIRRKLYWINDSLKGSPVKRQYNDICLIMENPVKGEKIREQHLAKLLKHATECSLFYKEYTLKSLSAFPVVNKSILLDNYEKIIIDKEKIPNQKGGVYIQRTSGSTGTPFAIFQNTGKRNRRVAELKYFGNIVGFKSHEKLVHLRAWNKLQNKSKSQSFKENIIAFNISNINNSRLADLCDIINKNKAVALRGYASSIDLFVRYAIENNIRFPSLKIIIAGSEALLDSTRDSVKQYLGCHIISQYANEENGILAQESIEENSNEEKHFYLNHASYFFEILKLNSEEPAKYGELGRIVVTDLFNYAFPVIRYDTGDTGILLEKDEYSRGYPVLQKLYGRRLDLVYDTEGNPVHPVAIGRILKNLSNVIQWQFIQKKEKEYLLNLNTKDEVSLQSDYIEQLSQLLGKDANIIIEYVDEVPVLASGKRKPVVNEWKK